MWASPAVAERAASLWESENPAVCLAADLISASQGIPVARQGDVLVAEFLSFQAAVLTARRLQWALQGFSEDTDHAPASIAVLIHASEEAPSQTVGGDLAHSLGKATPGQVLLTEKASQSFENIPGFPLIPAPGKGLRELLWRTPENQATRSLDEDTLARLMEERGVQEEPPEPPKQAAVIEDFNTSVASREIGQQDSEPPRGKSGLIIGAVAFGAVALAGVAFYLFQGRSTPATDQDRTQNQAQTQTGTPTSAPTNAQVAQPGQPPAAQPAQSAETGKTLPPAATKAQKNSTKASVKSPEQSAPDRQPAPVERPAPKVVEAPPAKGGRCDLDPSQYSGQIDQAWKKLGRGKYADAQREFGSVLACDPNNSGAKQGMERARIAARQADGSSDN